MARVPITVLLYNGPLLYGFNVPIKGEREEGECWIERTVGIRTSQFGDKEK